MKLPLKIIIHTLYWLVFTMTTIMVSMLPDQFGWLGIENLLPHFYINLVWAAVVFYASYFYVICFFEKGQLVKYLLISIMLSLVVSVLFLPIHKLVSLNFHLFDYRVFLPPMAGSFIIAQCGCLVRGFENWFSSIQTKAEIENKNLKNELELLKSQINPHFLFNTLNNIDLLITKSPKEASAQLITLSGMLRYMIYDTKTDFVPLQKEIDYLSSYIQLQKLRYKNKDHLKVEFPSENQSIQVAPMLFISFVENAFKHSFNTGVVPVIDISLQIKERNLIFRCINYIDLDKKLNENSGGFGLENVKRRLQLLYPEKHELQILKNNDTFSVELKIQL